MDIDVKNSDKNDKNKWMTIHEAIDTPYFKKVKRFPNNFLITVKSIRI